MAFHSAVWGGLELCLGDHPTKFPLAKGLGLFLLLYEMLKAT